MKGIVNGGCSIEGVMFIDDSSNSRFLLAVTAVCEEENGGLRMGKRRFTNGIRA